MKPFYTSIVQRGNSLLVRERDSNGNTINKKVKYQPTLYAPTSDDSAFTDIYEKQNLIPKSFESIKDAKDYIKRYKDIDGFDIFGTADFAASYINEQYPNVQYDTNKIRVFNFDIETIDLTGKFKGFPSADDAPVPIVCITLHDSHTDIYHIWGLAENFVHSVENVTVKFHGFDDEKPLLLDFVKFWTDNFPDIITGWNTRGFDIPYLVNRLNMLFGDGFANRLSPHNVIYDRSIKNSWGKDTNTYNLLGIADCDYLVLYKQFTYSAKPSYKLDAIGLSELDEQKLEYDGSITEFAMRDFNTFLEYNFRDVFLVQKLDDKMKLCDLVITISYCTGVNFETALTTVKLWETILNSAFKDDNKIPKLKSGAGVREAYPGGYVKPVRKGFAENVVSFDLASLYPSIIRGSNISIETMRDRLPGVDDDYEKGIQQFLNKEIDTSNLKNNNLCVTGNGMTFSTEKQGKFPQMMEKYYKQRKIAKGEMMSAKIDLEKIRAEIHKRGLSV
ncbi:MAG: 3'-5' exonuclease [Ghiorsea sp.]